MVFVVLLDGRLDQLGFRSPRFPFLIHLLAQVRQFFCLNDSLLFALKLHLLLLQLDLSASVLHFDLDPELVLFIQVSCLYKAFVDLQSLLALVSLHL